MSSPLALRLYGHGPTIAAAAAAAVATAAASSDLPEKVAGKNPKPFLTYSASPPPPSLPPPSPLSPLPLLPSPSSPIQRYHSSPSIRELLPGSFTLSPQQLSSISASLPPTESLNLSPSLSLYRLYGTISPSPLAVHNIFRAKHSALNPNPTSFLSRSLLNPKSLHSWHFSVPGSAEWTPWETAARERGRSGKAGAGEGVGEGEGEGEGAREGERVAATVVLLGWLGAKQRHMKRYAEFYAQNGLNAVTFVIPMKDLIAVQKKPGEKAEEHVEALVDELERWLDLEKNYKEGPAPTNGNSPEQKRVLMFHTFSNTGWLIYGAVLKRLTERHGKEVVENLIRGCVVDSAPVAEPTPQVWASGFSAAILKKRNVSSYAGERRERREREEGRVAPPSPSPSQAAPLSPHSPDTVERALLTILEKFFAVFLHLPIVKKKLSEITAILSSSQPPCPQLYIYSSSDKVIPASEVENFIALQKKSGKLVVSHRLEESPHVDHFRTCPEVYSGQLRNFLKECLPHWPMASQQQPQIAAEAGEV